jgi:hypothetical protein
LQTSNKQLKDRLAELAMSYENTQRKLAELQNHATIQQESLRQELETQKKLNEVLKKSDFQNTEKLSALSEHVAAVEKSIETKTAEMQQQIDAVENEKQELFNRVRDDVGRAEQLQERLNAADQILSQYGISATVDQQQDGDVFSPTAAALSKIKKTGKTFTEVVKTISSSVFR